MPDTRHLIAYFLIVLLVAGLAAVVKRLRYLSPKAAERRRRVLEREQRETK